MNSLEQDQRQAEIEAVELETIVLDGHIEMGEALERLSQNKDFQKIIMEGYLDQKVKSSVSLLAVPTIKERGDRSGIMEDLISASNLQYFFAQVQMFYESALDGKQALIDDAAEEEALALEEAEAEGGVQ